MGGVWVRRVSSVMERSGNEAKGEAGRAGIALGRAGGGQRQGAHDDAARQFDLEAVVAGGLGVGERRLGRAAERRRVGRAPASAASAARARQGFGATPPSASRASAIVPPLDAAARRRPRRPRRRRRCARGPSGSAHGPRSRRPRPAGARATISSPGSSTRLALRRVAGQAMERLERDLAPAAAALDLDHGVERHQRHAEIGRMGGDAVLAPAEHRVQAVLAAARVAAGAGLALVAGAGGVVEIGAARALQQVAADGRGIAQLRRGAGQQRFGDRRDSVWRSRRRGRGRRCAPARRSGRRRRAAARCGRGPAGA